jgi:hypothetical protein
METIHEAASNRFAALRADRSWGARVLAKDAAAVNERQTLLEILHGTGDDAAKAALASSIKLEQRPTLAAAERQQQAAADAAADLAPNLGQWGRGVGAEVAAQTTAELSDWARSLPLSPSTAKALLQQMADITNNGSVQRPKLKGWRGSRTRIGFCLVLLVAIGARLMFGVRRQAKLWPAASGRSITRSLSIVPGQFGCWQMPART